jgi:hypothetical protein
MRWKGSRWFAAMFNIAFVILLSGYTWEFYSILSNLSEPLFSSETTELYDCLYGAAANDFDTRRAIGDVFSHFEQVRARQEALMLRFLKLNVLLLVLCVVGALDVLIRNGHKQRTLAANTDAS